ncbi:tRNA methyl transferase PRC-barrel domain-containing protein, partial [Escherichia coli]|uniref:tRNA methyl transferase PRC-barrel domain-containing protein n=1 Tax=Escherichia coli TaxID=562 RepID=UPI0035D0390B
EHQGLMYHTLGQRKGLGIGGTKDGTEEPWYVVDKDVENNILIVAQGHEHPRPMSVGLIAQQLHWVDREPFTGTMPVPYTHPRTQPPSPHLVCRLLLRKKKKK